MGYACFSCYSNRYTSRAWLRPVWLLQERWDSVFPFQLNAQVRLSAV